MLVTDEAEHGWILGEWNQRSGRHAIFCDEGESAWFYLTEPGPNGPGCPRVVASVFVCNLVHSPPKLTEVRAWAPGPPPAAEGFAGPDAYRACFLARQKNALLPTSGRFAGRRTDTPGR